jgi:hypothetical protein
VKRHALIAAAAVLLFSAGFVAAGPNPTPPPACIQMSQNDIIKCLNLAVGAQKIYVTDLAMEVGTLKATVAELQKQGVAR